MSIRELKDRTARTGGVRPRRDGGFDYSQPFPCTKQARSDRTCPNPSQPACRSRLFGLRLSRHRHARRCHLPPGCTIGNSDRRNHPVGGNHNLVFHNFRMAALGGPTEPPGLFTPAQADITKDVSHLIHAGPIYGRTVNGTHASVCSQTSASVPLFPPSARRSTRNVSTGSGIVRRFMRVRPKSRPRL
jgi:hypothetical protein